MNRQANKRDIIRIATALGVTCDPREPVSSLIPYVTKLARARHRAALELEKTLRSLLTNGSQLSSSAFNISQDRQLGDRSRAALKSGQLAWDEAARLAREVLALAKAEASDG